MIACVSPGQTSAEHTINTLRYAARLKEQPGADDPFGPPPQAEEEHPKPPSSSDKKKHPPVPSHSPYEEKKASSNPNPKVSQPSKPTRPPIRQWAAIREEPTEDDKDDMPGTRFDLQLEIRSSDPKQDMEYLKSTFHDKEGKGLA